MLVGAMLSTKWMKLKPSPDIVETFAKYRWELSCGAWERSVEDGSAWDVASAQHGHQPPSLDTKCSQGVTPLPGTPSSITIIIIIIIIIIMAIVKWGYWHTAQCSLCALWYAEKFEFVSYLFSIMEIWIWILIVCGKEKVILLYSTWRL